MGPTQNLLHSDCLFRTGVNANPAIDTGFVINNRLLGSHAYGFIRTISYAGFTTGAFFYIYFSRHLRAPFKKQLVFYQQNGGFYKTMMILQHKSWEIRLENEKLSALTCHFSLTFFGSAFPDSTCPGGFKGPRYVLSVAPRAIAILRTSLFESCFTVQFRTLTNFESGVVAIR